MVISLPYSCFMMGFGWKSYSRDPSTKRLFSVWFIEAIWARTAGRMGLLPEASNCVTNRDSHLLTLVKCIAVEGMLITPFHLVMDGVV